MNGRGAEKCIHRNYSIRLVAGTANLPLAKAISKKLLIPLDSTDIGTFADGEIKIQLNDSVRGDDVFIIQPMSPPKGNDHFMELVLLINTLKLASAKRITAIIPYYGYARQDRKAQSRVPISASVVARLLSSMELHRVVTVDLHCGQIQGFFPPSIPVDNLVVDHLMSRPLIRYLWKTREEENITKVVVVSPDAGGVPRATQMFEKLPSATNMATITKRRVKANEIHSMHLVGDVANALCVIVDDIIDTAGTLCRAADLLWKNGAKKVIAVATHGVFSKDALEKISNGVLEKVFITDSIAQKSDHSKVEVVSLSNLLAETVSRIHSEQSVSDLFSSQ